MRTEEYLSRCGQDWGSEMVGDGGRMPMQPPGALALALELVQGHESAGRASPLQQNLLATCWGPVLWALNLATGRDGLSPFKKWQC